MAGSGTRDRVIAAIYESVIRPELYGEFMDAWDDHIQTAIAAQTATTTDIPPDEIEIDPELGAHFVRAYEILEQIGRRSDPRTPLDKYATADGFALVLTLRGKHLAASRRAMTLLGKDATLSTLRDELTGTSGEVLAQLVRAGLEGEGDPPPVVLATALEPRHLMARLEPGLAGQGPALVIEAMEYHWSAPAEAMLVASFGLSRAEVDVVRQLLAGRSLRQIAEQSGRSEHTVRNQAKAVLAKTGAPGQVDLIRLIVYLINQHEAGQTRSNAAPLPFAMMPSGDGREVQVCRLENDGKRSVLFFHGMLDGMAPLHHLRDRFRQRGLTVYAAARPGFGRSTPISRHEAGIDAVAEDITRVIDRHGLDRPVILAQLGGSLYGHAVASRLGTRVSGLVAVSGTSPFTRLAQFTRMAPRQRVVAYTARFAPALLPTVLRAGISQIDGKEIGDFLDALFKPGTHDSDMIRRLGLASVLHSGFRFAVEQGPAGFAADSHFIVRDWSREIARLDTRAIYINGAQDQVVASDFVVSGMAGRENVEVRVLPDTGQLTMYERPDLVLDAVDEVFASAVAEA